MTDPDPPLHRFQAMVRADPALEAELRQAPNQEVFAALVAARAKERGLAIDPADVAAALDAARHAWMLQWPIR